MAHFRFSAFADEASGSIKEQIAACHKNGIEFIELRNVDGKNISNFTVEEARELKKTLDEGEHLPILFIDLSSFSNNM